MKTKNKAIVALVFVAMSYALLSIAARLMDRGFSPITQVYLRIFLGFLLGLLFLHKNIRIQRLKTISNRDWMVLLLMGVIGYGFMVSFITLGVLKAKLINVSVISATAPFFAYFYSLLVFKTKFKLKVFLFMFISFFGVSMIASKSLIPVISQFGIGELYVVIAVACLSWAFVGRRMLSDHLNNTEISVVMMFIATVSSFMIAMIRGESIDVKGFLDWATLLGVGIGAIANIVSTMMENFAFQHIKAAVGSQILLSETLFALVFGYIFYHETVKAPEVIGAVLVIISVYIVNKYVEI